MLSHIYTYITKLNYSFETSQRRATTLLLQQPPSDLQPLHSKKLQVWILRLNFGLNCRWNFYQFIRVFFVEWYCHNLCNVSAIIYGKIIIGFFFYFFDLFYLRSWKTECCCGLHLWPGMGCCGIGAGSSRRNSKRK